MAVQLLLHGWLSHPCKKWWEPFQLFENKLDTRRASSTLSQKTMVKHLPAQIHISDTESNRGKKSEIYVDTNKRK